MGKGKGILERLRLVETIPDEQGFDDGLSVSEEVPESSNVNAGSMFSLDISSTDLSEEDMQEICKNVYGMAGSDKFDPDLSIFRIQETVL